MRDSSVFLAEQGHEEPSEAEMDALLQQYVTMLNAGDVSLEPMQDEESADAFLERAQEAGSRREMLKWIRKAREVEPDHVDAALMEIEETSKNPYEQEMRLFELQQKAEKQLREQGYFRKASIGDFWGLIETRPYMRVCQTYVGTLLMNRKMRLAAKACESMLRLCKNDRYTLIHLYGYLEEEQAAHKLFDAYNGDWGTRFPLAMAVLSYKQGKEEMAKKYLQVLLNNNKDTKKFFSAYGTKKMGAYASKMQLYAYFPDSIEELLLILAEHDYVYDSAHAFFLLGKGCASRHEEGKGHRLRKVAYVPAAEVYVALDGTGFPCAAACM
ncbi:hypothetical protein [uncultured Selenomonas sp.]|uniref:hypothetical protein n=2 Tax=uncultured Selenomonas sp. TaxID=159275 RepID=UPI0028D3B582|nr:hypothetical protein [uncultured Selenomonas sp.]